MTNNKIEFKGGQLIWATISLILFLAMSSMVMSNSALINHFDDSVTQWIQTSFGLPKMDYAHGLFNSWMTFSATYGDAKTMVIITFIVAIILFIRRYHILSLWYLAAVGTGGLLGIMMKNVIERPRPHGHLAIDDGFSFPSGHAVSVTLVCLALVLIFIPMLKKSWAKITAYIIVLLFWFSVLFSRIYFSAHHLTDVLSGVVLGVFWICIAMAVYGMVSGWLKTVIFKKSKI